QTDLRLLDTSQTQGAYVRLVFTPSNGGSPVTAPVVLLLPHEQKAFDNVLETLFGFTTDVSGPITVTAPDFVAVSTRTYNVSDACTGGTYGTWVPWLA